MTKVLVVYHSQEGHTGEVAEHIAKRIAEGGHEVDVALVSDGPDPGAYDCVIVGGSIHIGHLHKDLRAYARDHREQLNKVPNGFFQVSLTSATDDEEHLTHASEYAVDFMKDTGWEPDLVALVGGAIRYTRYGFVKRHLVHHIAKGEHLGTDTSRDYDYTDYELVDHFVQDVLSHIESSTSA